MNEKDNNPQCIYVKMCPNIFNPKESMMKILKWIVFAVIGLFVLAMFLGKGEAEKTTATTPIQATTEKPKADGASAQNNYKITAQQLYKDYEANEVAADEKMKGKIIELSGAIQSIDKDAFDNIQLHLNTGNEFSSALVGLEDSEKSKAMGLKKGSKIVAICKGVSRVVGSPAARDCVLQ